LSTVLLGGLVLSLTIILAVSGLVFVQRMIPLQVRQSHNVPIGVIYGALSVAFGIRIGFSAYLVLNKYTTSQTTVKRMPPSRTMHTRRYRPIDTLTPASRLKYLKYILGSKDLLPMLLAPRGAM
jgi:hypothetical protein